MPNDYTTPLIALAGTIFGGAGLEMSKRWLNRAKEQDDTQKNLRNEMRLDIAALRTERDKIEDEVDIWKAKYYEVWEKYLLIKSKYEDVLRQIQLDANKSIKEVEQLVQVIPPPEPPPIDTGHAS